ncbi:MAG TPA: alpha-E domain-containing protein [Isosphaeraceae bacterium]|jgi:uncharacterized alpha-E superfamily protein|nr:alpha-E domain-containing protein [Isosphaeraceae bacterium]
MLSRVAENLYWIGRYVERAENIARLLDAGFEHELDDADGNDAEAGPVESVLAVLACRDAFRRRHGDAGREAVLRFLTFDRRNSHSILAMIARARENARGTQEALSAEAWSQINQLYLYMSGPRARRRFESSPAGFFGGVKRACVLFDGLLDSTLPRTEAYQFLRLGRHLERLNQLGRLLGVRAQASGSADPARPVAWTSILQSCSAYDAYLRQFQDRIDPEGVVHYLVLDADFPRSMRFCVDRCRESLREINGGAGDDYGSEAERQLGRLDSELRYIDVAEILDRGLGRFLAGVLEASHRVGDEIHQEYFLI